MKITKTQLKQLIKEEINKTLDEIAGPMPPGEARDDDMLAFGKLDVTNLRVNPYGSAEGGEGYEFIMNVAGVGMISGQLNAQSLERLQKSEGGYQSDIMGMSVSEAQQIDELGIGTALKGLGGAIKGKAFDKVKGMKGPVAQDVQAQKQIERIVADMVKKDPDSAALYAQFLTKLAQSVSPAKTGAAGF